MRFPVSRDMLCSILPKSENHHCKDQLQLLLSMTPNYTTFPQIDNQTNPELTPKPPSRKTANPKYTDHQPKPYASNSRADWPNHSEKPHNPYHGALEQANEHQLLSRTLIRNPHQRIEQVPMKSTVVRPQSLYRNPLPPNWTPPNPNPPTNG